jgi:hypothetical protein
MRLKLFSGSAMFVNTLILVAAVTMMFILAFSMLLIDQGPKSFQKISVNVESIDDKGDMLYIKAEGTPETFVVFKYKELMPQFRAIINQNRFGQQIELTVSLEPDPNLRSGEKRIYGIEVKGEVAISPDQMYHAAKIVKSKILISLGIIFAVWLVCAFIILSAIKKPSIYPAWLSSRIVDFFRIRNLEETERDPYVERRL